MPCYVQPQLLKISSKVLCLVTAAVFNFTQQPKLGPYTKVPPELPSISQAGSQSPDFFVAFSVPLPGENQD